ncbi:hypothetical protein amrb99_62080 [Actinomadura sp. RB99]|uniref:hypothetical protein n=1 Tax=Actinomadura sp. RB99 TaxID=2691577 RepID=UPI001683F325|nr:hypothetical protein [Actinomadura sp. RB99]MBD2897249.1 hypothetical protein [Actinomadura sp. RB99]
MTAPVQRDEAWLVAATPAQITAAYTAGELAELLAAPPAPDAEDATGGAVPDGQVTVGALATMQPDEVAEAYAAGRLDHALGRPAARTVATA